jgi:predicted SAM-dependent methyltransferase
MVERDSGNSKEMSIKLDIGCGGKGSMFDGFIGIDIHPRPKQLRNENSEYLKCDFIWDATLPWKPETVDVIVAFHIIEHLTYKEGQTLIKRAYSLLKPGCQMFITCPDLDLFARKYIEKDQAFWGQKYPSGKDMWPGETIADRFNYHFKDGPAISPHKHQYSQESLIYAAKKAGCKKVEPMPVKRLGYSENHFWSRRPDHEIGVIITK